MPWQKQSKHTILATMQSKYNSAIHINLLYCREYTVLFSIIYKFVDFISIPKLENIDFNRFLFDFDVFFGCLFVAAVCTWALILYQLL